jgi:hypothetical protein
VIKIIKNFDNYSNFAIIGNIFQILIAFATVLILSVPQWPRVTQLGSSRTLQNWGPEACFTSLKGVLSKVIVSFSLSLFCTSRPQGWCLCSRMHSCHDESTTTNPKQWGSWTETSQTVSQNKPFLSMSWSTLDIYCSKRKHTNTLCFLSLANMISWFPMWMWMSL